MVTPFYTHDEYTGQYMPIYKILPLLHDKFVRQSQFIRTYSQISAYLEYFETMPVSNSSCK